MAEMSEAIEAHPGYMAGFYDAADLTPIYDDAPAPYRAGWEAYWRCRELFNGLEQGTGTNVRR